MSCDLKGYDGLLIHNHLIQSYGKKPSKIIMAGAKIMQMQFGSAVFIDSLNHIAAPLSSFPKTFGLDESKYKKGFFPYLFNTTANANYIGPIPAIEHFEPESMGVNQQHVDGVVCASGCKHCEFNTWYEAHTGTYNFKDELVSYCRSDVDILAEGLMVYIREAKAEHGIHPLTCVTAASFAMKCYTTSTCPTIEEIDAHEGHTTEVSPVLPGLKPFDEHEPARDFLLIGFDASLCAFSEVLGVHRLVLIKRF
jgi:hypothetical protein